MTQWTRIRRWVIGGLVVLLALRMVVNLPVTEDKERLLHLTAGKHPLLTAALLVLGAAPNAREIRGGYAPIHIAAYHGQLRSIRALLLFGGNASLPTVDAYAGWAAGITPLHCAVEVDNRAVVRLLLDHGARVNAVDARGRTPLGMARSRTMARLLLSRGASVGTYGVSRISPLHIMAREHGSDAIPLLLARGIPVNIQDADGNTPLHYAVGEYHTYHDAAALRTISLLLQRGAKLDLPNRQGLTPREKMLATDMPEIITLIRQPQR